MLWYEMSYRKYTKNSDNTEPEIWDEYYDPSPEEWAFWINEKQGEKLNATIFTGVYQKSGY